MPATDVEVAAVGNWDEWTLEVGDDKVVAVNYGGAHDDMGTTIVKAAADGLESYLHEGLPPGAAVVVDVAEVIRAYRYAGAAGYWNCWRRIAPDQSQCNEDHTEVGFSTKTHNNIARPGGGTWVPSDFDNIAGKYEVGVRAENMGGADGIRCTTVYSVVNWEYQAGSFVYMVSSWLPPLLAVASHGLTKIDVSAILSSLKTRPSNNEDLTRILEVFKRRPVWQL